MKYFFFLLFVFAVGSLHAARIIEVSAVLVDVAAGTEAPDTVEKLSKMKGVDLLTAPRITVAENLSGKVEVTQATPVAGGGSTALGVSLEVKTRLTDKGNIWFSGVVTDRSRSGGQKNAQLETNGFAVRELYFSGWTSNGGTAVLRTPPATSQATKNGKASSQSRELLVYLTLQTVAEPSAPGKKPAPSKKAPAKTTKKKR